MAHPSHLTVVFAVLSAPTVVGAEIEQDAPKIIIHTAPVLKGGPFECRIPVRVESIGEDELKQFDIAKVFDESGRELASTGVANGQRPLIGERVPGGWSYPAVPLQFDLTRELCHRGDSWRVVFARCTFGRRPPQDCLKRIEFCQAPSEDARLLPLKVTNRRGPIGRSRSLGSSPVHDFRR